MFEERLFGEYMPVYWGAMFFNCRAAAALLEQRLRLHIPTVVLICLGVVIGMWLERYEIVVTSLHRPASAVRLGKLPRHLLGLVDAARHRRVVPERHPAVGALRAGRVDARDARADGGAAPGRGASGMTSLLAGFASEDALKRAMQRARAGAHRVRRNLHPHAARARRHRGRVLPLIMFIAGIAGFIGFFLLMTYANVRAYPLDIGGRPDFAWPPYIPIAFELGVLCAMVSGFFGYFALCRMPTLYEPIDECEGFREASRDGWFLRVGSADAERLEAVRAILQPLGPMSCEEFQS